MNELRFFCSELVFGESEERICSAKTACGRAFVRNVIPKDQKAKTEPKLYPLGVVADVDKIGKRMEILYVGYSKSYDEWQPFNTEDSNPPFQRMQSLHIPSNGSQSVEDRTELVHGELHRAIKRKLYSGRKHDPATRVEIRFDQDVFDARV